MNKTTRLNIYIANDYLVEQYCCLYAFKAVIFDNFKVVYLGQNTTIFLKICSFTYKSIFDIW